MIQLVTDCTNNDSETGFFIKSLASQSCVLETFKKKADKLSRKLDFQKQASFENLVFNIFSHFKLLCAINVFFRALTRCKKFCLKSDAFEIFPFKSGFYPAFQGSS